MNGVESISLYSSIICPFPCSWWPLTPQKFLIFRTSNSQTFHPIFDIKNIPHSSITVFWILGSNKGSVKISSHGGIRARSWDLRARSCYQAGECKKWGCLPAQRNQSQGFVRDKTEDQTLARPVRLFSWSIKHSKWWLEFSTFELNYCIGDQRLRDCQFLVFESLFLIYLYY